MPRFHALFNAVPAFLAALTMAAPATASDVHNGSRPAWKDKTFSMDSDLRLGKTDGADYEVFGHIMDIAVNASGSILVLDHGYFCVREFDDNGNHIRSFGRRGEGPGEFSFPSALGVDSSNRVYVADVGSRVHVFEPTGDYMGFLRNEHPGNIIRSIKIAADGSVYLSCFEPLAQQIIHRYDSSHRYVTSFCDSYAIGQDVDVRIETVFAGGPIDLSPDGSVYFSQMVPYEIRKFSPDGELLQSIYRENDFVTQPGVTQGADGMTITMPTGSASIIVLRDGKLLNIVKRPETPDLRPATFIDLFTSDGTLLAARRLDRDMNIKCRDGAGRVYAIESEEVPAVMRYRLAY